MGTPLSPGAGEGEVEVECVSEGDCSPAGLVEVHEDDSVFGLNVVSLALRGGVAS